MWRIHKIEEEKNSRVAEHVTKQIFLILLTECLMKSWVFHLFFYGDFYLFQVSPHSTGLNFLQSNFGKF